MKTLLRFSAVLAFALISESCSALPKLPTSLLTKQSPNVPPYRGVFHVHTKYSHDSAGTLRNVIRAARDRNLDFALITDHNTLEGKSDQTVLRGSKDPLLIFGNEISTTDGHLIALGTDQKIKAPIESQTAIDQIHEQGGFAILAHPVCERTSWKNWNVKNYDGMEVYNFACDFYASNKPMFFLKSLLMSPALFIAQVIREPREPLAQWDSVSLSKPVVGFGAVDAHVRYRILGFPLMRYSLAFRSVTMYANAKSRSEKDIVEALVSGKSFIVFESRGSAKTFKFEAKRGTDVFEMGSKIRSEAPVALVVQSPAPSEIRVIRNGEVVRKKSGETLVFDAKMPGVYRVEVFRNGKIWIISNPITIQV